MEFSHSSSPHAVTPPPPNHEATSTHTIHGHPEEYDSSFENWLEEPDGASIPSRKGKGKMYQIVSSSSEHSTPSSCSDEDSDYEILDKGDKDAPLHTVVEDDTEEETSQGAPRRRARTIPPSLEASPEPYNHPPIKEWEKNVDWGKYEDVNLSQKMIEEIKKNEGKMSCVDLSSTISYDELDWVMDYYEQEGTAVVPLAKMKPHRFDIRNHRIPRMVLTPRHVSLGVGAPLHPYFEKI